jgi:hypothetical protein
LRLAAQASPPLHLLRSWSRTACDVLVATGHLSARRDSAGTATDEQEHNPTDRPRFRPESLFKCGGQEETRDHSEQFRPCPPG